MSNADSHTIVPPPRRSSAPLWVILATGSVITALSLGVRSTFGLFLDPVIDTLGTGRGVFALAVAIQNLVWGLSQPVAGAIADRFGSARVLATGGVIYAVGLVLMAQATSATALYLSAGFIVGAGTGAASFAVVLAAIGRMAPPERRSIALGVATAMGSVGQFVLVPLTQRLIDTDGWEATALVMAAVILAVVAFAPGLRGRAADQFMDASGGRDRSDTTKLENAAVAEDRSPAIVPLRTELRRAAHSNSYLMLNLAFFVCGFHVTFIATHLTSYAEDVGQTRSVAANALALVGLFNIAGSLAAGALGGRYSKSRLLSGIYFARAVVIAAFVIIPPTATTTVVFGAAIGVLWLSTVPLTSGIVAAQFGTAHTGTLFGIVFLSHQVGAFAGAWMGGSLADRVGSYEPVWWIAVGLGVLAGLLHLMIDESPQPEVPASGVVSTRPIGGAAAAAAGVALLAATTVGRATEAVAAPSSEQSGLAGARSSNEATFAYFCVLHPVGLEPSSGSSGAPATGATEDSGTD